MTIIVFRSKNWQDCLIEELWIDNSLVCDVYPLTESPEDAIIERDLVSPSQIVGWMKLAYEAGKSGEDFNLTIEENKKE